MDDGGKLKKVFEKIAKLRALSTSSNANEAATAAAMAAKLMDEHNIAEAELEAAGGQKQSAQVAESPLEESTGAVIPQWKQMLYTNLCEHFGVYALRRSKVVGYGDAGRRKTKSVVTVAGRPDDVATVRYFYAWLCEEIERLCKKEAPPGGGVAWHSTYKNGAATGVGIQLRALKKRERPTVSSQALVLLDGRRDEGKTAMLAILSPKERVVSTGFNWGSQLDAHAAGVEAGKNINLGRQIGSGDGSVAGGHKLLK